MALSNKYCSKFRSFYNNALDYLILVFLGLQFLFWLVATKNIKPNFIITPLPPSKMERAIFSFGDSQLLYRFYGFELQNAGDTFGEVIPLKEYDYEKLEKWFYALSELDPKSDYVPSIAGFYYAQSQNPRDNEYIVHYLEDLADKDPIRHWRWYVYASYLANYKLRNFDLSVKIAEKLITLKNDDMPIWARTMAIFASQKTEDACKTIELINEFLVNNSFTDFAMDKVYSANGGQYNFLLKVMEKRLNDVKNDPLILKNCAERQKAKKPAKAINNK